MIEFDNATIRAAEKAEINNLSKCFEQKENGKVISRYTSAFILTEKQEKKHRYNAISQKIFSITGIKITPKKIKECDQKSFTYIYYSDQPRIMVEFNKITEFGNYQYKVYSEFVNERGIYTKNGK
jgi:hypothetical protein